jgi:hypothetical protein
MRLWPYHRDPSLLIKISPSFSLDSPEGLSLWLSFLTWTLLSLIPTTIPSLTFVVIAIAILFANFTLSYEFWFVFWSIAFLTIRDPWNLLYLQAYGIKWKFSLFRYEPQDTRINFHLFLRRQVEVMTPMDIFLRVPIWLCIIEEELLYRAARGTRSRM